MSDWYALLGDFLLSLPTYLLNGLLAALYWVLDAWAPLLALLCAWAIARFPDARLDARAAFRPGRLGRAGSMAGLSAAQLATAFVALLWLAAQWGMGAPVPALGAAMWAAGAGMLLLYRASPLALAWQVKTGIAVYALAVIASRVYLAASRTLSPSDWAELAGSAAGASSVISAARGNLTTLLLWALWLVIPLGYFSLLLQQLLGNPWSLVRPLEGAAEQVERYRTRR